MCHNSQTDGDLPAYRSQNEQTQGTPHSDVFIDTVLHPLFCVTPGGAIVAMNNAAGQLVRSQSMTSERRAVPRMKKPNQSMRQSINGETAGHHRSRPTDKTFLQSALPFLWPIFATFLQADIPKINLVERVTVQGTPVEYHIQITKIPGTGADDTRAIVSMMPVPVDKPVEKHPQMPELLRGMTRDIRAFCHELSQPLMALAGYTELIELKAQDKHPQFQEELIGLQEQIHRIRKSHNKLRDTVRNYQLKIGPDKPQPIKHGGGHIIRAEREGDSS